MPDLAIIALACTLAACGSTATPVIVNGWDTYTTASRVVCASNPVFLKGWRRDLTLDGPCRQVVLAGSHNDVSVALAPGGSIEITGDHNDVTWHMTGAGPRPALLNHGSNNDFHAGG